MARFRTSSLVVAQTDSGQAAKAFASFDRQKASDEWLNLKTESIIVFGANLISKYVNVINRT